MKTLRETLQGSKTVNYNEGKLEIDFTVPSNFDFDKQDMKDFISNKKDEIGRLIKKNYTIYSIVKFNTKYLEYSSDNKFWNKLRFENGELSMYSMNYNGDIRQFKMLEDNFRIARYTKSIIAFVEPYIIEIEKLEEILDNM